jgi:hypothetical protein
MSTPPTEPSEDELRAAYEAELSRISSSEMILQTIVSLLNIGARRMGLLAAAAGPAAGEVDLEQVRDAIDAVRALLPVLERRNPQELRPMRDALSQLQMAYARQAPSAAQENAPAGEEVPQKSPEEPQGTPQEQSQEPAQGPAQASGRLWVPGR